MPDPANSLAVALFSEVLSVEQLTRARLSKLLPKGMELSHFSVLNHLAYSNAEKSPAELARTFHLTRGAMTNTLSKLEWAGWVHIRPDWDDARRKMVSISPAGLTVRDAAIAGIAPLVGGIVDRVGVDRAKAALPVLREMRLQLGEAD